jgi:hypothetical protein
MNAPPGRADCTAVFRFLSEAAVAQSVPVDAGAATLYDGWIRQRQHTNGLDPDLVRASYRRNPVFGRMPNRRGSAGIDAVDAVNAKSLGVTDAFDRGRT